jgi:hypothetical protein
MTKYGRAPTPVCGHWRTLNHQLCLHRPVALIRWNMSTMKSVLKLPDAGGARLGEKVSARNLNESRI